MSVATVAVFVLGLVALIGGAELLVRGSSRLAAAARISPIVVGLTVVAFGTSAPELAVTLGSVNAGQADLALGNVVGSNIFNVLFILGISAVLAPLVVAQRLVRLDVPLLVGVSILTFLLALDGRIGRIDGLLLFAGITGYLLLLVRQSRTGPVQGRDGSNGTADDRGDRRTRWLPDIASVAAGLVLLVLGAGWLVDSASELAASLGLSELVIGLTIVAAGTSLPELATSVLASIRGERDIAVGNVVGSNLFNLMAVLGLGSLLAPNGVAVSPGALTFDLPVMIAVAVATLPIFFTGYRISRWEGAVFVAYYLAYAAYLVLRATEHAALEAFGVAMAWFVIPMTVLTLVVVLVREARARGRTITR